MLRPMTVTNTAVVRRAANASRPGYTSRCSLTGRLARGGLFSCPSATGNKSPTRLVVMSDGATSRRAHDERVVLRAALTRLAGIDAWRFWPDLFGRTKAVRRLVALVLTNKPRRATTMRPTPALA